MRTTVSMRHGEVDAALRERAEVVLGRLAGIAPRAVEGAVVFDVDAGQQTAELKVHLPGGKILVATGIDKDHRTALDRAEEKVRRQVERTSTAARRSRRPPSPTA